MITAYLEEWNSCILTSVFSCQLPTGMFSTATATFHLKGVCWLGCSIQTGWHVISFQCLTWKIKDRKHRYFVLLQNFPEKNLTIACLSTSSCFHSSASSMRRPLKQSKVNRSDQVIRSCFKVHGTPNSFPTSEMWTQISSQTLIFGL